MEERKLDPIPAGAAKHTALKSWVDHLQLGHYAEAQIEGQFVERVLCDVLDYVATPAPDASVWAKPGSSATGLTGTPDVGLGAFGDETPNFLAVVEFKSPGTDLDKPQSRKTKLSPVEQAFEYGTHLFGCRWVLVSDMLVIRLYSVDDPLPYWEFDLKQAASDRDRFDELWWLLSAPQLLGTNGDSATAALLARSISDRKVFREGFYAIYYEVRADLYEAIREAATAAGLTVDTDDLLQATQRLLDRMIFIFYCEDHPQRLIPKRTFEDVVIAAAKLPGTSTTRIYESIKALFREVDAGSDEASGINVTAYNGELFKDHPIIDHIELPDSLNSNVYSAAIERVGVRIVRGVWGLKAFDFWQELGEHMLGSIFEESLSDLVELGQGRIVPLAAKLEQRRQHGIYYTTEVLSDYMARLTIGPLVNQRVKELIDADAGDPDDPALRLGALLSLHVVDLACGSGAFLVSVYREALKEYWRQQQLVRPNADLTLFGQVESATQATLLRETLFGVDLLPQAVEIAKLALWLRSARRGEQVSDLSANIVTGDSIRLDDALHRIGSAAGQFDLVIGNPPWGAEMEKTSYLAACSLLGIDSHIDWDSWELFLLLGLRCLRPEGRLCFVLPDSFLYPEKARVRRILVEHYTIVRLQQLGAGWFGPKVRMDTMICEVRNAPPGLMNDFRALLLSGDLRRRAIMGAIPLAQLDRVRGKTIPQERSTKDNDFTFSLFRDRHDDEVLGIIEANSIRLGDLCVWARGEEMSKAGLYWVCPSCLNPVLPGKKKKGGGYRDKACPHCGHLIQATEVVAHNLIEPGPVEPGWEPWIDGDDVAHRYRRIIPDERIRVDLTGWRYKPASLYSGTKVLIRQAGVALVATLDSSGARCPQSMYMYRVSPERVAEGYRNEFLLAALLSRTMSYVVFKAWGEVDPDKAHAKVTHERLRTLPIPRVDFALAAVRTKHDECVEAVRSLLDGSEAIGGQADRGIELNLRELWGLSGDDGAYINNQLMELPASQPMRELFPTRT